MSELTVEQFEEGYASRSGMTVERLYAVGLQGEPCVCGNESCPGWQMFDWTRDAEMIAEWPYDGDYPRRDLPPGYKRTRFSASTPSNGGSPR